MVNYLAIFLAAATNMIIGFLWYSNTMFGKQYRKLSNWDKKKSDAVKKDGWKPHGITFLAFLIFGYVMATIFKLYNVNFALAGATQAFIIALGLVGSIGMIDYIYARRPSKLYIINYVYFTISIIITGTIIGGMN